MPPARVTSFIPWLLLAVIALIAYGSLYPFNFKPDVIDRSLLHALSELSWARAGRGDRISNVLLYLPLGFCLFLLLDRQLLDRRWHRAVAVTIATVLGSILSLAIEIAQVYISSRVPSLTDLMLNSFGTLLGATIGIGWGTIGGWMHLPTRAEKPNRDPGAALLIGLWLAWRFAPFVPHLDLAKLKAALRPLFNPQVEPGVVLIYLAYWLIVSQALSALVSRPRTLEGLLLLMAVVLVGRLIVADQAFVPAELLALVLLLPLLVLLHRMTPWPKRLLLVGSIIAVFVFERLAPFTFAAAPTSFDFWPFLPWFSADMPPAPIDWVAFFGKLFLFGAVLWTLRHSGASFNVAAGALLVLVLATEVMQLWLPEHHVASITDPVLALLITVAFGYVLQRRRREFRRRAISRRGRIL